MIDEFRGRRPTSTTTATTTTTKFMNQETQQTVNMALQLGQQFHSYDEFMSTLQAFQEATRHRFIKHYQKTVQWAAQNNVNPPPQQRLRYFRLKMNCSRKESKAIGDCGTWVRLGVTKDGERLEIVAMEMKECGPPIDQAPPPQPPENQMRPMMSPMQQQQQPPPQQQQQPVFYDQQMYQPMDQYQAPPTQYDMNYQQPPQGDMQQALPLPSFGHLGGFQQGPMGYPEGTPQQYTDAIYQQPGYPQVDYGNPQMTPYPPQQMYAGPQAHEPLPPMQSGPAQDPQQQHHHHHQQQQPQQQQPVGTQQPPAAGGNLASPMAGTAVTGFGPDPQQMYQQQQPQHPPPPQEVVAAPPHVGPQYAYAPMPDVMSHPQNAQHYQDMQPIQPQQMPADINAQQLVTPPGQPQQQNHQASMQQNMPPYASIETPNLVYSNMNQQPQQMYQNHLQKALLEGTQQHSSPPRPHIKTENFKESSNKTPLTPSSQHPNDIESLQSSLNHVTSTPNHLCSSNSNSNDHHQQTQVVHLKDLSSSSSLNTGSNRDNASTLEALLGGNPRRASGSTAPSPRSRNSDSKSDTSNDGKGKPVPDLHLGQTYRTYKQAEEAVELYASPRGYKFRKIGSMLLKRIEGKEKLREQFASANAAPEIRYFALKFRCIRSRQLSMVSNYIKKKKDDEGQVIEPNPEVVASAAKVPMGSCNARITFQLNKHGTGLEVRQLDEVHDHEPDEDVKQRFAKGLTTRTRMSKKRQAQLSDINRVTATDDSKNSTLNPLDESFLNEHLLHEQRDVDLISNIQSLTEEIDKLSETDGLPTDLASLDALKHEDLSLGLAITEFDQKIVPLQNGDSIIGRTVYDDKERGVAIVKATAKSKDDLHRKVNGHHRELTEEQVVPKDGVKYAQAGSAQIKNDNQEDRGKAVPDVNIDPVDLEHVTTLHDRPQHLNHHLHHRFQNGDVCRNDDTADSTRANCSSRAQSDKDDSKESSPVINDDDVYKTRKLFDREIKKLEIRMCENVGNSNPVNSLRKRSLKGLASQEDLSSLAAVAGTIKKRFQEIDLKKSEKDQNSKITGANDYLAKDSADTTAGPLSSTIHQRASTSKQGDESESEGSQMNDSTRRSARQRARGKRNRTESNGSFVKRANHGSRERSPDSFSKGTKKVDDSSKLDQMPELRACKVVVQMAELPKDFEVYWNQEDVIKQLDEANRDESINLLKSFEDVLKSSSGEYLSHQKQCLTSLLYHWRGGRSVEVIVSDKSQRNGRESLSIPTQEEGVPREQPIAASSPSTSSLNNTSV